MSKHTKAKPSPAPPAPAPQPAPIGADILRKMLLAVLTAILAARPFVRAEDAGMLSDFSDPGGMVLTLLTFCVAVGWAAWRLWSDEPGGVYFGPVEIGLFALAAVFFIGAFFASYARPAFFTAAEWVGLAVLLFLVRQLACRPHDQHGLVTALLATAVTLSAQGVFQAAYELPKVVAQGDPVNKANEFINLRLIDATTLEKQQLGDQFTRRLVSGPFFHPASMAGALVLLLPVLAGAVVACVRGGAAMSRTLAVLGCLLLAAVVLGLTRDAPAVAALAVVALPWAGAYWPARLGGMRVGLAIGVVAAAGVVVGMYAGGLFRADLARWREVWPAAWRMSEDYFWRGVGPAQFRFYYPRYMAESAGDRVTQPSSAVLEVLSEVGVLGLVLLLVTLGLVVRLAGQWGRQLFAARPRDEAAVEEKQGAAALSDVRWEYYLGGMLGALVAFTLRANSHSTPDPFAEVFAGAVRVGVWFFAFALFDRVTWSPGEYVGALLVGVGGLVLALLVGPGVSFPAVAALMWLCVGLALAVIQPAPADWIATRYFAGLSVPALIVVGFVYFAMVLYPASVTVSKTYQARYSEAVLRVDRFSPDAPRKLDARKHYDQFVLPPLLEAAREDPANAALSSLLASAFVERWTQDALDASNTRHVTAVQWAKRSQELNPEGRQGYEREYQVREHICRVLTHLATGLEEEAVADEKKKAKERKLSPADRENNRRAAVVLRGKVRSEREYSALALEPYLPREPTDARLRYRYATACFESGTNLDKGREAAREALRLDDLDSRPYRFAEPERQRLKEWIDGKSAR